MKAILAVVVTSLSIIFSPRVEKKVVKFKNFDSNMETSELKKLSGFRNDKSYKSDDGSSFLYIDNKDNDRYNILIWKNQNDKTYLLKIIMNISGDITNEEAINDIIYNYSYMGENMKYESVSQGYSTLYSTNISFGCKECKEKDNIDCFHWFGKFDKDMNLCATLSEQITSRSSLRWVSLYWHDPEEENILSEFQRSNREATRRKLKF